MLTTYQRRIINLRIAKAKSEIEAIISECHKNNSRPTTVEQERIEELKLLISENYFN
jgi:hypothetical protein